jgi:hypothetical protein
MKHGLLCDALAIDSTQLDTRYRSRHYEQRCRHHAKPRRRSADSKRSATARTTPKLIVSIDIRSHLALSLTPRLGMGSDAPEFLPVLRAAKQRHPRLRLALADAGFDSHENHRVAREELKVRSLIKVGIGRPTHKRLSSKYRRRMQRELSGSQRAKPYGQRAQSETFNSMFKRNLEDHLRSRTGLRRKLRRQKLVAGKLSVFIQTDRHSDSEQYGGWWASRLLAPTDDTRLIAEHAAWSLRRIFRPEFRYKKAGVLLMNLCRQSVAQRCLFVHRDPEDSAKLMAVVDRINQEHGRGTIRLASASPVALNPCRTWHLRSDHRSPRYTTRWEELPTIMAREGQFSP